MYYITDLYSGETYPCETEKALAIAWRRRDPSLSFDQLNITGKDTYMMLVRTGNYYTVPATDDRPAYLLPERKFQRFLKQYLITDEHGRHVDIRTWPKHILNAEPSPVHYWFGRSGAKRHFHRLSGPSGFRRNFRLLDDNSLRDELEDIKPVLDKTRVRPSAVHGDVITYDWYELKANAKWQSSKAWKDQCKARRQYQRHGAEYTHNRRLPGESGEDLAARLSKELGLIA